jgi:hypothetical protein
MRKISESKAFKAPTCTLFNMLLGPPVGAPLSVRAPLEPIKGRARTLEHKFDRHSEEYTHARVHTHAGSGVPPPILQAIHHTVDIGYYAQAARTTLNLCVLPVFIRL